MTQRNTRNWLGATFVFVAALAPLAAVQASASVGSLTGCLHDQTGQVLPGATIDVRGAGVHRVIEATAAGCYEVKDLPVGTYGVVGRLTGFISGWRDDVAVEANRA